MALNIAGNRLAVAYCIYMERSVEDLLLYLLKYLVYSFANILE